MDAADTQTTSKPPTTGEKRKRAATKAGKLVEVEFPAVAISKSIAVDGAGSAYGKSEVSQDGAVISRTTSATLVVPFNAKNLPRAVILERQFAKAARLHGKVRLRVGKDRVDTVAVLEAGTEDHPAELTCGGIEPGQTEIVDARRIPSEEEMEGAYRSSFDLDTLLRVLRAIRGNSDGSSVQIDFFIPGGWNTEGGPRAILETKDAHAALALLQDSEAICVNQGGTAPLACRFHVADEPEEAPESGVDPPAEE